MGPEEFAEKTTSELIRKYGIQTIYSLALLVGMWLILNQMFTMISCAREDALQCQTSLVEQNQKMQDAVIELTKTLAELRFEVQRLTMAIGTHGSDCIPTITSMGMVGENGG